MLVVNGLYQSETGQSSTISSQSNLKESIYFSPIILNSKGRLHKIMDTPKIVTESSWNDKISWRFVSNHELPDIKSCSAVMCILISDGKLVLTRQKDRGWEIPGGHIDDDDKSLESALRREVREETGTIISQYEYVGFKEVNATEPIPHRDHSNRFYPNPGYIPYFITYVDTLDGDWEAPEVVELQLFPIEEALELLAEATVDGRKQNTDQIVKFVLNI